MKNRSFLRSFLILMLCYIFVYFPVSANANENIHDKELMEGRPSDPTSVEFNLIANHIFVLKNPIETKPISFNASYHQWRDIWDDNLYFHIDGNTSATYRAISLTTPLYIAEKESGDGRVLYKGYIAGISVAGGQIIVCSITKTEWCEAPKKILGKIKRP